MGEVWVADSSIDGVEVAVKLETRHEARVLDAVRHPNVVELLGTGAFDETRRFMVMELLRGRTLAAELAIGGPLSLVEAGRTMRHVAAALEHIHAVGLVHRDIKPQNLFVCGAGDEARVKVIDFGLAAACRDRARWLAPPARRVAGSLAFMHPGDLLGEAQPSAQSDVWALAVTTYLMLTQRLPFRPCSSIAWRQPTAWSFEPPGRHRSGLPARVDGWFRRAFSRDASERFQCAADASREFCEAIATPHVSA